MREKLLDEEESRVHKQIQEMMEEEQQRQVFDLFSRLVLFFRVRSVRKLLKLPEIM